MIGLIDGDGIPFIACHNKKDEPEKTFEDCIKCVHSIFNNIVENTNITQFIVAFTKGRCFRYDIYPSYKANRKYDNLPKYLKDVKDYIYTSFDGLSVERLEADDIIMIYKNYYKDKSIIISSDKDLLNIQGDHFDIRHNKWVNTTENQANYYFAKSLLVGDSADNIKGIKGIGEVKAESILSPYWGYDIKELISIVFKEYINLYGEINGIDEFYKNYKCLKILDNWDGFNIKEPNKIVDELKYGI